MTTVIPPLKWHSSIVQCSRTRHHLCTHNHAISNAQHTTAVNARAAERRKRQQQQRRRSPARPHEHADLAPAAALARAAAASASSTEKRRREGERGGRKEATCERWTGARHTHTGRYTLVEGCVGVRVPWPGRSTDGWRMEDGRRCTARALALFLAVF